MGANVSTDSSETADDIPPTSSSHLLRLCSRQFERDEVEEVQPRINTSELYLEDYGDEPDEAPAEKIETPSQPLSASDDDDDYPTERMSLKQETQVEDVPTAPSHVPRDIHQTFEASRSTRQDQFDSKYPKLPDRPTVCHSERDSLMQCYKDNEDILNCKGAVETYSRCAKSYSESVLVPKN